MPRSHSPFDSERTDAEIAELDAEYGDQKQQIDMDGKASKDFAQKFHAHLDECEQCREHPFQLCQTGRELIVAATQEIKGDPFA